MADVKIPELPQSTSIAAEDLFIVNDTSDTSGGIEGTTKYIRYDTLFTNVPLMSIVLTAGENITSQKAVRIIGNQVFLFKADNATHYGTFAGISKTAASLGSEITVQTDGIITVSFAVTNGASYFASDSGGLSTAQGSVISQRVGVGIDTDKILIVSEEGVLL